MSIQVVAECKRICHLVQTLPVILVGIALPGCSPGGLDSMSSLSVTTFDSAGVSIVVSPESVAHADLGWKVDSVPNVVIGKGETPAATLYRVQGVRDLPSSGILVVDGGSRQLRLFTSDAQVLRLTGGDGAGPGEFRDPVLVPWVGTDSIMVFDTRLRRLQVFSQDGTYQRTIMLVQRWPSGGTPLGAVSPHAFLVKRGGILGGEMALQDFGLRKLLREYFLYDPETARQIALDTFVVDWNYRTRDDDAPVPFSSRPAATVASDGVLISSGRSYQLQEYGLDGRLRQIFRIDMKGVAVTPRMVADLNLDPVMRAGLPLPDTLPRFHDIIVDSENWVWAEVYNPSIAAAGNWIVFDPKGVVRGNVSTPAGLRVARIGYDFILGVWTDDLGVEHVHRYSLRRNEARERATPFAN